MSKIYSDGQGGFLHIDDWENDDFISFRIEEEQEDGSYIKATVDLHKSDIENLIIELKKLTFSGLTKQKKELLKKSMDSENIDYVGKIIELNIPSKPISEMRKIEEGFDIDLKCSYIDYKNMATLLGIKLTLWQRFKLFITRKYK